MLPLRALVFCVFVAAGCQTRDVPSSKSSPGAPAGNDAQPADRHPSESARKRLGDGSQPGPVIRPELPWTPAAAAHAGLGTSAQRGTAACRAAVDAALAALGDGADALEAVVQGIRVMEDNPDLNAGLGSRVRLDGETVQMDAVLVHSDGRFGAVGVVERVRNPILVARAVLDTPHLFIAGDGATRLARANGLPDFDPATTYRRDQIRKLRDHLVEKDLNLLLERHNAWAEYDWAKNWNFEKTLRELGIAGGFDTVGVIARDRDGNFAAGLSTGGTEIMLRGRVGDVPVYGAGAWAGQHGAVAATGSGERIIENLTARNLHVELENGIPSQVAANRAVDKIRERGSAGLVVISPTDIVMSADREMAWAGRELDSKVWLGTEVPRAAPEAR